MFDHPLYYDRKGQPMDMMAWARQHEDDDCRTVAQHWVRGWMVSTVWLGIDHNFTRQGPPVIFETMVFPPGDEAGGHGVWSGDYCERYSTEEAAQAGHDRALAWIVDKIGDPAAVMEIMSPAQFSDAATAPDDPGDLT
jgi:hypothetical protein